MSEQDTKEIALKLFRIVNGSGDGGSESAFDCLNGAIKDGWMRLAKIGAKDSVIGDLESRLSASQAREAELREKLEAAESRLTEMQNQEKFRFNQVAEIQSENAELRKLLEEAKSKAVPEGWQLVPKIPTFHMCAVDRDFGVFIGIDTARQIYEAMLTAAPQPENKP